MNIDPINNGIVIDHIKAGNSMEIYKFLDLDNVNSTVALIKNVPSKKMGRKDIIKIDQDIDINLDVLGYIDPDITVNIIKNGVRTEKKHLALPSVVKNVIKCKNPRCITSTERGIPQVFKLTDKENRVYRCMYCESSAKETL